MKIISVVIGCSVLIIVIEKEEKRSQVIKQDDLDKL